MGYIYPMCLYISMEKEKIIIKNTELETTPDGVKVVRVTLQKGSTKYIRGIKYGDLIDKKAKKSVYRAWRKSINKIENEKVVTEEDAEVAITKLIGEELPEEDE